MHFFLLQWDKFASDVVFAMGNILNPLAGNLKLKLWNVGGETNQGWPSNVFKFMNNFTDFCTNGIFRYNGARRGHDKQLFVFYSCTEKRQFYWSNSWYFCHKLLTPRCMVLNGHYESLILLVGECVLFYLTQHPLCTCMFLYVRLWKKK